MKKAPGMGKIIRKKQIRLSWTAAPWVKLSFFFLFPLEFSVCQTAVLFSSFYQRYTDTHSCISPMSLWWCKLSLHLNLNSWTGIVGWRHLFLCLNSCTWCVNIRSPRFTITLWLCSLLQMPETLQGKFLKVSLSENEVLQSISSTPKSWSFGPPAGSP